MAIRKQFEEFQEQFGHLSLFILQKAVLIDYPAVNSADGQIVSIEHNIVGRYPIIANLLSSNQEVALPFGPHRFDHASWSDDEFFDIVFQEIELRLLISNFPHLNKI